MPSSLAAVNSYTRSPSLSTASAARARVSTARADRTAFLVAESVVAPTPLAEGQRPTSHAAHPTPFPYPHGPAPMRTLVGATATALVILLFVPPKAASALLALRISSSGAQRRGARRAQLVRATTTSPPTPPRGPRHPPTPPPRPCPPTCRRALLCKSTSSHTAAATPATRVPHNLPIHVSALYGSPCMPSALFNPARLLLSPPSPPHTLLAPAPAPHARTTCG